MPPEENPNIEELNKTKSLLNGQASFIGKKTDAQDERPANEEPINLDVGKDKAAEFINHVELPEPDPRFHARSIN